MLDNTFLETSAFQEETLRTSVYITEITKCVTGLHHQATVSEHHKEKHLNCQAKRQTTASSPTPAAIRTDHHVWHVA